MFVVIKLGGCNGSGKTSVARALIDLIGTRGPAGHNLAKADTYYQGVSPVGIPTIVLASYAKVCGGMDTISDKDDRLALVKTHARPGHIVFFEGLITGKTYGALGQLSEEHRLAKPASKAGKWLYAFMDTPFEECVRRTEQRRAAAAAEKGKVAAPLDPERTLRPTFDSCQHLYEKLRGERQAKIGPQPYPHPTILLNHTWKPARIARTLLSTAERLYANG